MPTLIKCSSCLRQLRIPDTAVYKSIKCPACEAVFVAEPLSAPPPYPAPQGSGEPERPRSASRRAEDQAFAERPLKRGALAEAPARPPRDYDDEDAPLRRRIKKGRKEDSSKGLVVALSIIGGLLLAAGMGVGGYFLLKGSSDEGDKGVNLQQPVALVGGNGWQVFSPAGGHYKVLMPSGNPNHMAMNQAVPGAGMMTLNMDIVMKGTESGYMVMYMDMPGGKTVPAGQEDFALEMGIKGFQQKGGKIISSKNITLNPQGYKGKEIQVDMGFAGHGALRFFIVRSRLFFVAVIGKSVQPSDPDVVKFFNSFQVDDKAIPDNGPANPLGGQVQFNPPQFQQPKMPNFNPPQFQQPQFPKFNPPQMPNFNQPQFPRPNIPNFNPPQIPRPQIPNFNPPQFPRPQFPQQPFNNPNRFPR